MKIVVDGQTLYNSEINSGTYVWNISVDKLFDGIVNVYLGAYNGDMYFDWANIHVWADRVDPIPEPATMLLLGSGLIGLAGAGRKRIK